MSDQTVGLLLALSSSLFIGASFVIKKRGLRRAGSTGLRAGRQPEAAALLCGRKCRPPPASLPACSVCTFAPRRRKQAVAVSPTCESRCGGWAC